VGSQSVEPEIVYTGLLFSFYYFSFPLGVMLFIGVYSSQILYQLYRRNGIYLIGVNSSRGVAVRSAVNRIALATDVAMYPSIPVSGLSLWYLIEGILEGGPFRRSRRHHRSAVDATPGTHDAAFHRRKRRRKLKPRHRKGIARARNFLRHMLEYVTGWRKRRRRKHRTPYHHEVAHRGLRRKQMAKERLR